MFVVLYVGSVTHCFHKRCQVQSPASQKKFYKTEFYKNWQKKEEMHVDSNWNNLRLFSYSHTFWWDQAMISYSGTPFFSLVSVSVVIFFQLLWNTKAMRGGQNSKMESPASGFKWHHQCKTAAPISRIFWPYFRSLFTHWRLNFSRHQRGKKITPSPFLVEIIR